MDTIDNYRLGLRRFKASWGYEWTTLEGEPVLSGRCEGPASEAVEHAERVLKQQLRRDDD